MGEVIQIFINGSKQFLRIGVRTSVEESFEDSQNSRQDEDDVDKTRRKDIDVTRQQKHRQDQNEVRNKKKLSYCIKRNNCS